MTSDVLPQQRSDPSTREDAFACSVERFTHHARTCPACIGKICGDLCPNGKALLRGMLGRAIELGIIAWVLDVLGVGVQR